LIKEYVFMKKWLFSAAALCFAAIAPCHADSYSQAKVAGDLLFVSGQLPLDPNTGKMMEGDIASLTNLSMNYVKYYVLQKGFKMRNIVKTVVYLRDIRDYSQMDAAYALWFPFFEPPARDVIVVSDLPDNSRIQINCIASKRH
jgi:2-iminobutanoate/2-iminopropanoate deaminase